jgi:hypothetical protein
LGLVLLQHFTTPASPSLMRLSVVTVDAAENRRLVGASSLFVAGADFKRDFTLAGVRQWPRANTFSTMFNRFQFRWVLALCGAALAWADGARATPVISEFMASNKTTLADEDGTYADWLELYNPDETEVNLAGWYLTDNAKKLTKWKLPAVTLPPRSYLVVFASSKDRADPAKPLHTNFDLSAGGEYLGLIQPDGVTVASEYAPIFPAQVADVSYGLTEPDGSGGAPQRGFFATATPGAANGGAAALALPASVTFSRPAGTFAGMITVSLTGAGANQHIRYELVLPSGAGPAAIEPTAGSALYTGPIAIGSSTIVRARVFNDDDTQHGPTAVASYVQLATAGAADLAGFTSALPLLVLDDHGAGELPNDGQDHAAWLQVFTPSANGATTLLGTPQLATPVVASIRGYSSANFPKKSYNFDLLDAAGRDNPQELLGLAAAKDWALVSPWYYDRAYVRNAYVYALGRSLGHWAPQTKFVELFVNTGGDALDAADYVGISLLSERIKVSPTRVNITALGSSDLSATDITGGYVLKIDDPGAKNLTWTTAGGFPSTPGSVLNVDSPKADKLALEQAAYIKGYVQEMENALFADHASGWATRRYLRYIDRPSWVDYHLLNVFVGNVDALQRSTYFTKDRGGKLVAGPLWDFDRSMGSADGRDAAWDQWQSSQTTELWEFEWWGELAHDPDFMQAWVDRWQSLRRSQLSAGALTRLADTLAAQVTPEAAARDAARWADNAGRFPGGFAGEIAHIKDWITHRAVWIDQRFVAQPLAEFNGRKLIVTPPAGAQLAYTFDGSDPRASGGTLAPTATRTSEALVVDLAATPGIRIRTYDPRYEGIFPSSPWSAPSLVTELPQASRLVNLSSRGFVGAGDALMLSGVVVRGSTPKRFLARAVGPGLANFGVTGVLPDPVLRIVAGDGALVATNVGWETSPDAVQLPAIGAAVGAFPLTGGSADSAVVVELPPGGYTVVMASASGRTGVGLIELYELDSTATRVVNLSTRAFVAPGEKILIGGLAISGFAPKRVLVRAVGPTLAGFGVDGAMENPLVSVMDSNQRLVGTNDDWSAGGAAAEVEEATATAGAFALPRGSKDAALVLTLDAGNYTLQMTGAEGGGGVALLEVYELPDK